MLLTVSKLLPSGGWLRWLLWKLAVLLAAGFALLVFWCHYWGIVGQLGGWHFDLVLHSLPPWQKRELADAVNHHYNSWMNRYTKGMLLRCEPTAKSIKSQFNWYHRDTVSAMFAPMPDYHAVVLKAIATRMDIDELPEGLSTYELESLLVKAVGDEGGGMTRKDQYGLGFTFLSLGLRLGLVAVNPFVGIGVGVVSLAHSALSDPAKGIPGIVHLHALRRRNASHCFLASWLGATVFICWPRGGGKRGKRGKRGTSRPGKRRRKVKR